MLDVVSADTRLVATDPGIPGLRDVLSPLGLVRRLAPAWDVADARVVYLRYKPATSLVAGLRLTAADGATSFVQALALGVGAPEKLAKVVRAGDGDDVGRGAVVDPRLGVALSDVTADRHLPGVGRVLHDADGAVTPLVYKPGRRWVAREERTDGSAVLVKVHRRSAVAGVLAGHAALTGLPVVTVAEARERRGTVRHPWLPGRPLDALVGPGLPDLWSCAGAVLAAVHAQPSAEGLQRVDRAVELAAAVAAVRAVAPLDLAAAAASTAERVLAQAGEAVSPRVVHGDFSADQVIVRPDLAGSAAPAADQPAVTLVDLDRVGLDDPAADLASWYGALVATGTGPGDPHEVLAPLLEGYLGAGGDASVVGRLRLLSAAAVLQRATEPFRRHLPDWPEQVARLVTTARELAS